MEMFLSPRSTEPTLGPMEPCDLGPRPLGIIPSRAEPSSSSRQRHLEAVVVDAFSHYRDEVGKLVHAVGVPDASQAFNAVIDDLKAADSIIEHDS